LPAIGGIFRQNGGKTADSNFFSDYARVLVFGPNDFSCGVNNLRNHICDPLAVYTAKTVILPPFF
jgi:hypothetical protein